MLKQQMQRKMQGQKGFTLLELLVVVAIMAFIVAMVAPRFAGITGGTVDVVCDTNQQRMIAALSSYQEQKRSLPGGMVNLVNVGGLAAPFTYQRPPHTGELTFADQGQATFFEAFFTRNQFQLHTLNDAEAKALRELGIGSVYNLNHEHKGTSVALLANPRTPMERASVAEGLNVLMVGMGAVSATADVTGPAAVTTAGLLGTGTPLVPYIWGNPEWLGRIILGVGPESDLVKQGMITAAGLCPGGVGNERVFWNNYSVLLPRLQATTDRIPGGVMTGLVGRSNGDLYRAFDLRAHQEGFMFLTQCPEGHRFATADNAKAWHVHALVDIDEANNAVAPGGTLPTFPTDPPAAP
jgi:prepilin-type N-terminal cleavage/methylation domain-containing protein